MLLNLRPRAVYALLAPLSLCLILLLHGMTSPLQAQSLISGDLAGQATDPAGAALVGAKIVALEQATGSAFTTATTTAGAYRLPLLKPGAYTVTASAPGFADASTAVTLSVGQVATVDFRLTVRAAATSVEVTAAPQLLQSENAMLTTVVDRKRIEYLPNPGSDVTNLALTAPGVLVNTGADPGNPNYSYGNFSAFGLPGTSNNVTVNGMQVNDPYMNLPHTGPTNLALGLNDVEEAVVIANAYDAQYGSLGGVQLNLVSRSGSNRYHGNLSYGWNGNALNANDWFNKSPLYNATPLARPASTYNQWAAAIGGPIQKDKLFFFLDTEGVAFSTSSSKVIYLPSDSFNNLILGTNGLCTDTTSALYRHGRQSQCAVAQRILGLYKSAPIRANAVVNSALPTQLQVSAPSRFSMNEAMIIARIDANLTAQDRAFARFKYDHGVQPTYSDPINSAFDAQSDQPYYEGQMAWTRALGLRAVNQLMFSGSWYSAIFAQKSPQAATALLPMQLTWYDGFAYDLNASANGYPSGRQVVQFQLADDFNYTRGRHALKAGFSFRRNSITDLTPSTGSTAKVWTDAYWNDFNWGEALWGMQSFSSRPDAALSLFTLGIYLQDDWKARPNLTISAGVRIEKNSNISCAQNCFSNLGGDFFTMAQSAPLNSYTAAYNQQIHAGQAQAFLDYQKAMIEPRVGFAWSIYPKTVLRGGFGVFADVFPGQIAGAELSNPPFNTHFEIAGSTYAAGTTLLLDPSSAYSAQSALTASNAAFQKIYAAGGSAKDLAAALGVSNAGFALPSFTAVSKQISYPTYYEWSLQVQQELTRRDVVEIGYVGNRGYHEPGQSFGANAYSPSGGYGLPTSKPAPSFGTVTVISSQAVSNYNGLVLSYRHEGRSLTSRVNYVWSHALDEISNGGMDPFNARSYVEQIDPYNLRHNYGNADYDVRHALSANFVYELPYYGGPRLLTKGWLLSGVFYYNSGMPFTPRTDTGLDIQNFGNGGYSAIVAPKAGVTHQCGASAAVSACLSPSDFAAAKSLGDYERNQFWGPHYANTDLTLLKGFDLPWFGQAGKLQVGSIFYNLFNHPNFGPPSSWVTTSKFGKSTYLVGPSTNLYGSHMNGKPAARMVELTAKVTF